MSVCIASPILTSGCGSLQFCSSLNRQWRSMCRLHSLCRKMSLVHVLCRPSAAIVGSTRARKMFPSPLSHFNSTVRWYSNGDRSSDDDRGTPALKGVVVQVPNPLSWLRDKWFTYRVRSLVDSSFCLKEFQSGAKQVQLFVDRVLNG